MDPIAGADTGCETGGDMKTCGITIPIYGLSCGGGGALNIENALAKVPGVARVYVNLATEKAYIRCDPSVCDLRQLWKAIENCGFRPGAHEELSSGQQKMYYEQARPLGRRVFGPSKRIAEQGACWPGRLS